jgi:serine/threonine protein kinase
MELVKGGDLFDCIVEKERYTQVEARRTMRRLLAAVYYLHEHRNIVHRDLKPENVLCSSPTHVKLADFGLAKIVKTDGLKTFCGTPAYFAPEVLQRRSTVAGQGRYGKPADIWSLGVILYILLTGKPPFDANLEESQNQFEVDFESDNSIWSAMPMAQELVQHMLRQDPKRRLTVRQCCDHPWINVDDGDTHCHPLDDPTVTTKKRLFENIEVSGQEQPPPPPQQQSFVTTRQKDDTSYDSSSQASKEDDSSVRSKDDSVLSKEEFSFAAVYHHSRNDSFFHVDTSSIQNKSIMDLPNSSTKKTGMDLKYPPPQLSNMSRPFSPSPRDVKAMSMNNAEQTDDNGDVASTSGVGPTLSAYAEEHDRGHLNDKSCNDADSPPRSPLANLDLNDRCNRFREQVLQTSSDQEGCRTAVTPTCSNVRKKDQQQDINEATEDDNEGLDPILSQFSNEPSSIESFGDSIDLSLSCKGNNRTEASTMTEIPHCIESCDSKKRGFGINPNNNMTPNETRSKRPRVSLSNSKQTTLKSWLVKKDNQN